MFWSKHGVDIILEINNVKHEYNWWCRNKIYVGFYYRILNGVCKSKNLKK